MNIQRSGGFRKGVWLIVVVGAMLAAAGGGNLQTVQAREAGPGSAAAVPLIPHLFNNDKPVGPVEVTSAVYSDESAPVRDLTGDSTTSPTDKGKKDRPLRVLPNMGNSLRQPDGALQTSASPMVNTTNVLNFAGVGYGDYGFSPDAAPPDTNGAVGATQYVQWVNESFAVFDKTTGAIAPGFPKTGNSIWSGFGGGCQTNNDGDPIAQYDKAANRWVMTQFSVSTTPYLQCVAVSTTSDATGSYYRYAFSYGNTQFNDYPKLGVWPDGYYISYNIFNNGVNFAGSKVCSLERTKMLSGDPSATQQCFQLSNSFGGLLPSDLDGTTPPPAGSPNFFLNFGSNSLNLWKFHVDFVNSANSTFTGPTGIPVASFTAACSGGGACIPQAGTTQKLDSLADRLMYRLAYRNFGDHEALVVNHSVTAGSSVGVRWYEIRNPNGTPNVFQQGTYAPDTNFRWMGSIAMDKVGNIALGYSVSSSTQQPSIKYTGRAPGDPLGTLQAENNIQAGGGSQLTNLSRWGDYSAMTVDPVDDCTFWYTNEYLKANGTFNWSTQIASFQFASCTNPQPNHTVTFNANGGTGSMSNQVANVPTALTLNAFTRTGYSFSGWNTLANGSGTAYADGATYSFAADVTLNAQWTALPNHTVTFNANGGTGSMSNQTANVPTALTLNAFTRAGYSFNNWNTLANGTGTTYANGATYSFAADITLYAQWTALPNHTVTFNSNGGTGSMSNQTANVPTALTLNAFTRAGYSFNNWNTLANGSGTTFTNGATYSFAADITLYAQWTALPNHTVIFNSNGGTGSMSNQVANIPTALTLNAFTRAGYSFNNWNTLANGSGTTYANGATYSFAADITLYAQWTALPNHTVTFNANGGTGSMSNQVANIPTALTLNTFTRAGFNFAGWNTLANGSGSAYSDGATYTFAADVTLYAQWSTLPNHTVTFNSNGGTGSMSNQVANVPTALTLNAFTRAGYSFNNWNTAANGSGSAYADGATYSFAADVSLYAQWSTLPNHTVTFNSNGGTGSMSNQVANVPTALTLNTFTRSGFNFAGWNTATNGSGTAYADGATYSFAADVSLYAQWTAQTSYHVFLPLILHP